ncbi:hypothetical protein [Robertkochia flava]|nr:hypothetical protein [Robertkochia marina]
MAAGRQVRTLFKEIAYEPVFKYPRQFTRIFKKNTGISANEYHMMN